jgi:hypothetical protein
MGDIFYYQEPYLRLALSDWHGRLAKILKSSGFFD